MDSEWLAFFATIKHEYFEEVKDVLLSYSSVGGYIISKEISSETHKETNGEHMHFIVRMSKDDYHRFSKRIFKDKFGLRGRAQTDLPRQYGRVKQIENLERMKAYTLKDGHFETNLSEEEIQHLVKLAAGCSKTIEFKDGLMNYLNEHWKGYNTPLKELVLMYHIEQDNGMDCSLSSIDRYIRLYILYFSGLSTEQKLDYLKCLLL